MRLRLLCGSGNAHRPPRRGADPSCDYNQVTLTAEASDGWVFDYWWGDVTPGVSSTLSPRVTEEYARIQNRNYNPAITLAIDKEKRINAHFVYRPGISGLDLVADLGEFLVTIGVNTEASDVYNLDYDRGDFTVDGDANDVFTGNGIPDAAEFALLEAVLKDATIDYARYGGVVTHYVWKDWEAHVTRAEQDLPNASSAVVNTVAAYTTLGGYARGALIESLVNGCAALGATIDSGDYTGISSDWFGADDDPDANAVSNADVWATVSAETFASNEEMVAAFAVAALNHETVSTSIHANNSSGSSSCEECFNDTCADKETISVDGSNSNLTFVTRKATGKEACSDQELSSTATAVSLGHHIELGVKESIKSDSFHWEAAGTMIDGSKELNETFIHAGAAHITARSPDVAYVVVRNGKGYLNPFGTLIANDSFTVTPGTGLEECDYSEMPDPPSSSNTDDPLCQDD